VNDVPIAPRATAAFVESLVRPPPRLTGAKSGRAGLGGACASRHVRARSVSWRGPGPSRPGPSRREMPSE